MRAITSLKTIARNKAGRIASVAVNGLLLVIKGITGIIIISLVVIITAACYVICLPLLLFGNMKQIFKTDQ